MDGSLGTFSGIWRPAFCMAIILIWIHRAAERTSRAFNIPGEEQDEYDET